MRMLAAASLLVGLALLSSNAAAASCPRTGGEKARRIGAAIMIFPWTPLVLRHRQTPEPMPSAGARGRVSHEVEGRLKFTDGRYVSAADSVIRLITANGDTLAFPRADARCLQIHWNSPDIGAGVGLMAGMFGGMAIGAGAGAYTAGQGGDPYGPEIGVFAGAFTGSIVGSIVGVIHGASAWDVAWKRAK